MYLLLGILFTIFSTLYSYDRIIKIKLKDFEQEDEELRKVGIEVDNSDCTEMRLNKGIFSDNYLMLFSSILLSLIFIFIKGNDIISTLFTPVIPILCTLFLVDIRMKHLPNYLTYFIVEMGLIFAVLSGEVFNNFITAIILFSIYFVITIITGGAIGGGDIKLIGALGLFFNTNLLINVLVYPFILGAIQGCYFIFIKKKKGDYKFSFGPVIILSILLLQFLY